MKTPNKNQMEGKLGNRNAQITEGRSKKWLLYLTDEKDPLIGFVHANSREEALDRMAVFGKNILAVREFIGVVLLGKSSSLRFE